MTGEFEVIRRLVAHLPPPGPDAAAREEVWIGDDAAAVAMPVAPWLLLAADAVVAGVHADLGLTGLDDLGWKAMVCNLSDLAAMGGVPTHALVTVAGPPGTDLDALYEGIGAASATYGCPVVGGDLSNADALVVTVAVAGTVDPAPVRRGGARPGDGIWVTGPLGGSAAGLRLLRAAPPAELATVRSGPLGAAHARPVPRLAEGLAAAAAGAGAMIDVSDGLAADLGHIADASGVGFELDVIPVRPGAEPVEALGGGEDYELVFCAPDPHRVARCFAALRPPVRIGTCGGPPGRRLLLGQDLGVWGWEHRW